MIQPISIWTASVVSSDEEVFDPSLTVPSPDTEGIPSLTVPSPGNEVLCDNTGSHSITVTPCEVFKTIDEIERFIMRLQIDHHHPLKVYKSENQLNVTIRKYSNSLVNIL